MKYLVALSLSFGMLSADNYGFPDPYPEVYDHCEILPLNRHGWYLHNQLRPFFQNKEIKTVVEVGVWTGNNAIYLAEMLPDEGVVFAVDHWLGSREHQDPHNGEHSLLPTLFRQFLSNVIHTGQTQKIIPVRLASVEAARKLQELHIRADLIYLDADHDYPSVIQDIETWYPLLSEGGVLCGDDWCLGGPNGDIAKAVREFGERQGLKVCAEGEFWWYE
ncbi:MAG: class I SAM-dependent methyltransferase [Verrucomicrobia bacterium]|nr:class I SAM-dependent methyltransferase [Verrucomicrobiota bacterium]